MVRCKLTTNQLLALSTLLWYRYQASYLLTHFYVKYSFKLFYWIQVNYGGVATKKSPYRVKVEAPLNPALVHAYGPGLDKNVKTKTPTHFNVNCREAGPGELKVDMKTPDGRDLPINLNDNDDGTYTVDYVAPDPGVYTVDLNYGGLKVPQSPFKVNVTPHVDVSKVKVDGLSPSKFQSTLKPLVIRFYCNELANKPKRRFD